MMLLQYLGIFVLFLVIAYILDAWHTYTDNKRLKPILEAAEYKRFKERLQLLIDYDPCDYEYSEDLVKILPRELPFDKEAYLKSTQWQDIRRIILRRDNYACCKCGIDSVPLEVHHITYVRLGHEHYSDLASLCRTCHQSVHDKHGYNYHSTFPIGD